MSREVDERVVEMRFDNAQFEKGTRETMNTLDRLQQKLQFKDVDKGFEAIDQAQRNVDFDEMGGALDAISVKFNALDVMAVSALSNITNKIVDTGEKLVKSLSVDQVMSGWNKYTEKSASIQTIMNATGKSLDQVNGYLNKLMWFSDETSYGFTDMTSALATLTSSGGDIEKLIPMIEGIANATAYAGKGATEFSRAIFNLAQSYGTGSLQLIDWKSVAQAGVGSEQLKQILIETGEELGTLQKGAVTVGTFENSLQKKWATQKVMEKGFAKFASLTEAAYQAVQAGEYDTASEAIEALADSYDDVAVKAFKSAQEAKSFAEAIDATKDAVSSSWMKLFENIFGNKEEATATWTELANRLYDIFVPPIEDLSDRVKDGLDSGWDKLMAEAGDQADVYAAALEKAALQTGAVTQEMITEAGSFSKALKQGKVNGALLQNGLTGLLTTMRTYLAMSDKELNARNLSRDSIREDYDALLKLNEAFQDGTVDLNGYAKSLTELSGREHLMQSLWNIMDALGALVQPIHEAFQEIFPPTSGKQISSFAEGLDDLTSRLIISEETAERLKTAFKGLFSVVKVGTTAISKADKAVGKVLGVVLDGVKPVGTAFLETASGVGEFLTEVQEAITGTGSLSDRLDTIRTALKKLLSPMSSLKDLVKYFSISNLQKKLSELIRSGNQNLNWMKALPTSAQKFLQPLLTIAEQVANGGLTMLDVLGTVAAGVVVNLENAADFLNQWVKGQLESADGLETTLTNLPKKIGEAVETFAATFKKSVSTIEGTADDVFSPVKNLFTALKEGFDSISGTDVYRFLSLVDVGLLALTIGQLAKATKSFSSIVSDFFDGPVTKAFKAMTGSFNALSGALKSWTKTNNTKVMRSIAVSMLMFAGSMAIVSNLVDPDRFAQIAVVLLVFGGMLIAAAKLLQPAAIKMENAFEGLKARVLDSATLWGVAAALLGLAAAVGSITKGLAKLVETLKEGNIAANTAALAAGAISIVGLILGMKELMDVLSAGENALKAGMILSTAAELIALGTAIKILSTALKPLSEIKFTSLVKAGMAIVTLGGLLTAMATALAGVGKLIGPTGFQNGASVAAMASGLWIVAQAVIGLASIKLDKLDAAMTCVKTLMVLMTAMSALSAKTKFTSGAAIFLMSSSLIVLAGAVGLFAVMGDAAMDGLSKVALGLTAISIASRLAGSDGATSILTISGAMLVLAGAVAVYARLGNEGVIRGLIACAAGLAEMAIVVAILSKLTGDALQAAWVISTLSGGMIKLAAACAIFNFVKWQSLVAAGVALGGLLVIIFGAGALATKLPLLTTGLTALGIAFEKFGSGALKLAAATAVLGILSMFAGPICQAIINAAPDIQEALITVIDLLCNVIQATIGPITEAILAVATNVTANLLYMFGMVDEETRDALTGSWENIKGWFEDHSLWELLFGWLLDADGWIDAFTAKDRPIGALVNWLGGLLTDSANELEHNRAVGESAEAIGQYYNQGLQKGIDENSDTVTTSAAAVMEKTLEASRKAADINSPSGVMAEQGHFLVLGLAEGLQDESSIAVVTSAMQSLCQRVEEQFRNYWGIHSPSLLAENLAAYIPEGEANGIEKGASLIANAVDQQSEEAERHYSSYREEIIEKNKQAGIDAASAVLAPLKNGTELAAQYGADTARNYASGIKNAFSTGAKMFNANGVTPSSKWLTGDLAEEIKGNVASLFGGDMGWFENFYQKADDLVTDVTGGTPKGKTGSSSKTQKTAAENLADEYSKKLKSNKAKMDAANKEYSLWETETGDTASAEEFIRKKTESLTTEITNQTDRVAIAKEQYDKLVQEATATEDQKNEAYSTWLDESQTLAELKREKQNTIFKAIKERYNDEASTATDEYELWSALYEDTATVEEKSNKKIQNINRKLTAQAKVVTAAEDAYTELKAEFGEKSLKTQEAYRQLLEAQTDYAELNNDLNQAQLDAFDDALALMEKHEKLVTNRQNMLAKIYDDGDLSQREEAYKNAVEQYGADSAEARKAATQGTMSSIIAVGTALNSMSFSLKKNTNKQDKYNQAVKEFGKDSTEALEALADLQDEQYSFVGFAENLADAFEMDDSGKKMMMQLGYAVSRNWKPIQNGFQQVWQKVQQNFPQIADKMANAFGVATSEGFTNVATDLFSVITSLVSGDWGTALTSGIAAVVDFMGSDFGQNLMQNLAPLVTALPEAFTTLAKGGKTLTVMGKSVTVAAESVGELGASSLALLGDGGIFASIGGAFAKLAAALGPEGWLVLAISAGVLVLGGLIIKNWDKVTEFFEGFAEWMHGVFSNIWDGIKNAAKGVGDFFKGAWDKASEAVGNVVETGKNFVQGFAEGVANAASTAWNGVKDFCGGVLDSVKSFFGIHSPSTVMAEMGGYVGAGFANGVTDSSTAVGKSMSSLMQSAMDAATLSAEMIQSVFDSDAMDYEPTIRPVVDLDGAQESAQWLQSAFADANGTYGAAGTAYTGHLAGTIAERRPKNQNGAETVREPQTSKEVLEAIDAIGERVDDLLEAIRNMKLSINGRKLVGEIISDVDTQLITLAKRSRR